jgi:hypothetical protein
MNTQTATPYMIKQAEKEMKMLKTQLIVEAGQIIREYDKDLAESWDWAPFSFQRLGMAHAFAAGFCKNESDDPHPMALVVINIAYKLREMAEKYPFLATDL